MCAAVSGPVGIVCSTVGTPVVMVCSVLALGAKYGPLHIIGALLIVASVPVSLIPALSSGMSASSGFAIAALLVATVPTAIESVWLEHLLQAGRLDMWWLMTFLPFVHCLFNLPLLFLGPALQGNGMPFTLDAMWTNLQQGFACFFAGTNANTGDDCRVRDGTL